MESLLVRDIASVSSGERSSCRRCCFQFGHDHRSVSCAVRMTDRRSLRLRADSIASFHWYQATDSVSRSRWEITAETPSPRMVTP